MAEVLAIDIGGTSVKYSTVSVPDDGRTAELAGAVRVPLPSRRFADLREVVLGIVRTQASGVSAIGISTAGSMDRAERVLGAGNFDDYVDVVWSEILTAEAMEAERDLPVTVVNDGHAAAWGEYALSSRAETHVHIALGTGVGGGIVHRGELLAGESGQGGSIGHIRVTDAPTIPCVCGSTGHVESFVAERAICGLFAQELGSAHLATPSSVREIVEGPFRDDAAFGRALARAGHGLGAGLGTVLNVLNPSVVTVGGGIVVALRAAPPGPFDPADALMAGVVEGMRETAHRRPFAAVECRWGELGNDAGLVGAALLAATRDARGPGGRADVLDRLGA